MSTNQAKVEVSSASGIERRRGYTRRAILKSTAAGGALAGLPSVSLAGPTTPEQKEQFLIDHITWGRNEDMTAEYATQGGYTQFLNSQLAHTSVLDPNLVANLRRDNPDFADVWWDLNSPSNNPVELPNIAYALGQPPLFARMNPGAWVQMYYTTVQEQALLGYHSRRQLYWTMAEFWQNVHNTWALPIIQRPIWQDFFRDNIAKNALGYYGDMVKASGQGASMLFYLNQLSSTAASPIENYARELLELHTVGARDGDFYHPAFGAYKTFTEADIVPVAEIFTGWYLDFNYTPQTYGRFKFDVTRHKPGAKFVPFMNKTYANTGQGQGEELIADLAGRPPGGPLPAVRPHVLTAFHMAKRLMEWFICEDAYSTQFAGHTYRVAAAFWSSYGDIKATIRALFNEADFDEIRQGANQKVRNPLKLVTAVMRAVEPTIRYPNVEWGIDLQKMGRTTGDHKAPDGYSNANAEWTASMMARFEFVYDSVYDNNNYGWTISSTRLNQIFPANLSRYFYANRLNDLFYGGCLPASALAAMQAYLDQLNQPSGPYQGYDLRLESLVVFFSHPTLQFLF